MQYEVDVLLFSQWVISWITIFGLAIYEVLKRLSMYTYFTSTGSVNNKMFIAKARIIHGLDLKANSCTVRAVSSFSVQSSSNVYYCIIDISEWLSKVHNYDWLSFKMKFVCIKMFFLHNNKDQLSWLLPLLQIQLLSLWVDAPLAGWVNYFTIIIQSFI